MADQAKTAKAAEGGKELHKVHTGPILSPFEDMERWFEGFFPRGWMRPFRAGMPPWAGMALPVEGRVPRVDVIERDGEIVVRAEVPGFAKDELQVSVAGDSVTIRGETGREEKEEKGEYYRAEIARGAFSRTIPLPGSIDPDGARASFKDGVLELVAPKVEKTQRRSVKVE